MDKRISDLRQNYSQSELNESDLLANPIDQFRQWFDEALNAEILEPNAASLSTSVDAKVHSRIILLKEIDPEGFVFYTNYESAKGTEIESNPNVALCFLWKEIERQVRIEGTAAKIPKERSEAYAQSRPRTSQIGAWVSEQSTVIKSREVIEKSLAETTVRFEGTEHIPKPEHWGGYLIKPTMIEFWQGRTARLHDRLRYRFEEEEWIVERLSP